MRFYTASLSVIPLPANNCNHGNYLSSACSNASAAKYAESLNSRQMSFVHYCARVSKREPRACCVQSVSLEQICVIEYVCLWRMREAQRRLIGIGFCEEPRWFRRRIITANSIPLCAFIFVLPSRHVVRLFVKTHGIYPLNQNHNFEFIWDRSFSSCLNLVIPLGSLHQFCYSFAIFFRKENIFSETAIRFARRNFPALVLVVACDDVIINENNKGAGANIIRNECCSSD